MQRSEGEAMPGFGEDAHAYGCVFCLTGKEARTAESIERSCEGVRAMAARQTKFKTEKGKKSTVEAILFPGYVFFRAPAGMAIHQALPRENVLSILRFGPGDWRLHGKDEQFARWLFSYDGLLPLSRAYQVGDRVHIHSGPLKDLEGHILRVDKRNRSGQVALQVGDRVVKAWLGFEWVDEGKVVNTMDRMPKI